MNIRINAGHLRVADERAPREQSEKYGARDAHYCKRLICFFHLPVTPQTAGSATDRLSRLFRRTPAEYNPDYDMQLLLCRISVMLLLRKVCSLYHIYRISLLLLWGIVCCTSCRCPERVFVHPERE